MVKESIIFQDQKIRRILHEGEWYFSVVDVVGVLSESENSRKYWNKLNQRLCEEESEVVTNCHRLKLMAEDGKLRETDCANKKGIFRIIQSIPSKKAEPFKLWLAKVGSERIDTLSGHKNLQAGEIENPELAQYRAREYYEQKGYPKDWMSPFGGSLKPCFEYSVSEQPMTDLELIFNMLGEASTTKIAKGTNAQDFGRNKLAAKKGGKIAGDARKKLEVESGEKVVSNENYLDLVEKKKKLKMEIKSLENKNEM